MNPGTTPLWLSDFQEKFGTTLRQELNSATGTLHSTHSSPGLAAYNTQYWFRLFTTLQQTFPLLCRILGYWHFNQLMTVYLRNFAPHDWDLGHVGHSMLNFLYQIEPQELTPLALGHERLLLQEAATIDLAFDQALEAIAPIPWQYDPSLGPIEELQLQKAAHWQVFAEHWELLALRSQEPSVEPMSHPIKTLSPRRFTLICQREGVLHLEALSEDKAQFFLNLCHLPLQQCLYSLQESHPRDNLEVEVQEWLAQSIHLRFWR